MAGEDTDHEDKTEQPTQRRLDQALEKGDARLRIGEAAHVERPHLALERLWRIAEQELQMRVRGERGRGGRMHHPDVHTFVHRLEEAREGRRAVVHHRAQRFFGGTGGVGVLVRCCGVHFRSIAARMLATSAPEL